MNSDKNPTIPKKDKVDFLVGHEWEVGLLFIILVCCMVCFEKGLHYVEHRIAHATVPQRGLKNAVKKLKDELLVTGFLSLLLTALQAPLHNICIGTKASTPYDKAAGKPPGAQQRLCKHLFDYDSIHYAHILLFFVAVVNIAHGVSSLLLGIWQVMSFGVPKVWKENEQVQLDTNGQPIYMDKESVEAEAPKLLPLSDRLQKDLRYRVASGRWWVWWSIKRQFMIIGPDSVVTRDLYRAARQCCLQYLNTITYRKYPDGTIEYADMKVSNPFKQLLQQRMHIGGHKMDLHTNDSFVAARPRRVHLTRAQLPFVYLASQCLQYNFCKATNADVLLPLMIGVAFLLQPAATRALISILVWSMVAVTWVLGVKLQWILLHMAMRYHTLRVRENVRRRYRTLYQKWKEAKAQGYDVDNGDYVRHLQACGVPVQLGTHASGAALLNVPIQRPPTHTSVLARARTWLFGSRKYFQDGQANGSLPQDTLQHIRDTTTSRSKRAAVEYWTTRNPDTSCLFWLQWPGLVRVLLEVAYYTNSLVVALALFCAWKAPLAFSEHPLFWIFNLGGVLHNFWHLCWMVVPAFAVISTTGRHTPMQVVGEVQRMAAFSHLLVAVRAKHRTHATGKAWRNSRYLASHDVEAGVEAARGVRFESDGKGDGNGVGGGTGGPGVRASE